MNQYPEVAIEGKALASDRITSCTVHQRLNAHWVAMFTCVRLAGSPTPVEEWVGKSISIGSQDQDGTVHPHFAGFIVGVNLSYAASGTYTASVTAYSKTWLMDQSKHKQYYYATTLQDIASQMAARMGGSASIGVGAMRPLNYVQYAETDFSFLDRVVDDYKAWLRPTAEGFEVLNSFQPGTSLNWRGEVGGDLMSFSLGATVRPGNFQGSHYDFHAMQSQTYLSVNRDPEFYDSAAALVGAVKQAALTLFPPQRTAVRARVQTNAEFETTLKDESDRAIGSAVTGTGTSRNMQLKAGNTVALTGNLSGAAGIYGLIEVIHEWSDGGYLNTFVCTPWKVYRQAEEPTLRTWSGIVPARVTAHNDPKKMGRIQVQFFWQEDGSTHWARATSPHAGPDRGFMFMPEVGDEVAVAFEDGDPERPVILGSLWNGVHQQPRAAFRGEDVTDNSVKRIMTRSGNRIQISDKPGVETISIATPNHNVIRLTEQSDMTGRTNITLESRTGDIVLHAPNGRVHIESKFYSKDIG